MRPAHSDSPKNQQLSDFRARGRRRGAAGSTVCVPLRWHLQARSFTSRLQSRGSGMPSSAEAATGKEEDGDANNDTCKGQAYATEVVCDEGESRNNKGRRRVGNGLLSIPHRQR